MPRTVRLIRETTGDPALDTAVSRALLERVDDGSEPETLRLYRPQPNVAFGRQDAVAPGYPAAVRAARRRGFEAVERLAGGRAAVFHEDTVALAWEVPDRAAREHIRPRFEETAAVVVEALVGLGVDARVGDVPGEYCPGDFSVNARGATKLMGVGQRIVRDAAHVGGVLVVAGEDRVRDVLVPVYEAMAFDWRPETTGSVSAEVGPVGFDDVVAALVEAFGARHDLVEAPLPPGLVAAARARRDHFLAPA